MKYFLIIGLALIAAGVVFGPGFLTYSRPLDQADCVLIMVGGIAGRRMSASGPEGPTPQRDVGWKRQRKSQGSGAFGRWSDIGKKRQREDGPGWLHTEASGAVLSDFRLRYSTTPRQVAEA